MGRACVQPQPLAVSCSQLLGSKTKYVLENTVHTYFVHSQYIGSGLQQIVFLSSGLLLVLYSADTFRLALIRDSLLPLFVVDTACYI